MNLTAGRTAQRPAVGLTGTTRRTPPPPRPPSSREDSLAMPDHLYNLTHPADVCDPAIAPLVAELCALEPVTRADLALRA